MLPLSCFVPVTMVDVMAAVARLHTLVPSVKQWPYTVPPEWASAQMLFREIDGALSDNLAVESVQVVALPAGKVICWHAEEGVDVLHMPLVTGPGVWHYAGPQAVHIEAGSVVFVNSAVPVSVANTGRWPSYFMRLLLDRRADNLPVGTNNEAA